MQTIEPVEIQFVKLAKRPMGYATEDVDRLLEDVTSAYEDVWRERDRLRLEVDRLRGELEGRLVRDQVAEGSISRLDDAIGGAIARAQTHALEILEGARREATATLDGVAGRHDALRAEIRRLEAAEAEVRLRLRSLLTAALDLVEPRPAAARPGGSAASQPGPLAAAHGPAQPAAAPIDGDELTPA